MIIESTIQQLRQYVNEAKQNAKTIGFVPTMGYLHEGHLTLVQRAKEENDIVVMSIFVNPAQFGPNEDYERYPRDLERDAALAESAGVDFIFAPTVEEMYPTEGGIQILAGRQSELLCGASRPGHFDGVLKVVCKLFHLVQPTRAYFGQKDAQQLAIIETMVRDYNFPLEIRSVPIVREDDGLAKSSRNVFLSEEERKQAPALHQALQVGKKIFLETRNANEAIQTAKTYIETHTNSKIDYLEMLTYPDLTSLNKQTETVLFAVAAYFEQVRLIDNVIMSTKGE